MLAVASGVPLPGFLQPVAGSVGHYGYWAIALLLLLENIGVPVVPGELALIAGAVFAGTGQAGLNVVIVGVIAVVCCFVGAEIGYGIGRMGGRAVVLRYGRYAFVREHHLDRAEAVVTRYGGPLAVIARFVVGLREFNGIIAGIAGMEWRRFLIFNGAGAVLWVAVWVSAGYLAGDHITTIYADVTRYLIYVLAAAVALLAVYIYRRLLSRRRHALKSASEAEPGTPSGV